MISSVSCALVMSPVLDSALAYRRVANGPFPLTPPCPVSDVMELYLRAEIYSAHCKSQVNKVLSGLTGSVSFASANPHMFERPPHIQPLSHIHC